MKCVLSKKGMGVGSNFFYMTTPIDFIEVFKVLLGGLQRAQKGNEYRYYLYANEHLSIKRPDKDNHHCLVLTTCHFGRVWCTTVNYTITFLVPRRLKPVTTQKSFKYKCSNQVLRYLKVLDRKPISSDVFWRRNYGVILRRLRQKGRFNTAG